MKKNSEKKILKSVIESLILSNAININNKSENEIIDEFTNILTNSNFTYTMDHTKKILKMAETYYLEKSYNFACLFYAMWFEHWINKQIVVLTRNKRISEKDIKNILKSTPLNGKFTWMLSLLDFPKINKKHLDRIFKIADLRNSFVHYKFSCIDDDKELYLDEKKIIADINQTIKYLKNIENKHQFKNSKNKVLNKILNVK